MPREAGLFDVSHGSVLRAYLLLKSSGSANIPPTWIDRARLSRKGREKESWCRRSIGLERAAVLLDWRSRTPFNQADDWLFASPNMRGQQPYWPETLLRRHIRPAAKRAGITKTIGWHTLRHTYATLLKANGEDVKTVQELLRHANSSITLDVYTQAVTPAKRLAQRRVVEMLSGGTGVVVPFCSHGTATPEGASH